MRFNEIGLKDLVLDFDSNDLQDITVVQGDTKTRGFKVLVSTNNGEIIKANPQYEMRLYGVNSNYPDKSFFTKATIDGDFYKVYISTDMASKSGKLQLQLALFEGTNALIQSRIKEVDVYSSIANGGNVGKDLVVDFGKLQEALDRVDVQEEKYKQSIVRQEAVESKINQKHTEVVQIRDGLKDVLSTENARVEAEKKRVSAENTRASQESTRQSNENTRQSNETARQQKESTRQSNETQRQAEESTRKSDEQKRITAETNRDSAETKRDNAEKIRVENENKRITSEKTRAENDTEYNKNEEQRQAQESTRQTQEQQRVDAEKLRQSQEDTRKQQEDTRNSQESTRQTQEQSRIDAESKRATSETSREQSEQTRDTNETERQNAEQERATQEDTRKKQESDRVEAEKQREKAENDRAGKFAGWDKTMQGVIPTATSTVAGIVRIDIDGESMAVSKKTYDEDINEISEAYDQAVNSFNENWSKKADVSHTHKIENIAHLQEALDNKANKMNVDNLEMEVANFKTDMSTLNNKLDEKADRTDVDGLKEKVENFKVSPATSTTAGIVKIDVNGESTAISEKTYNELCNDFTQELDKKADIVSFNSIQSTVLKNTTDIEKANESLSNQEKNISNLNANVNAKAGKKHTHAISDVDGLRTELDDNKNKINIVNNRLAAKDSIFEGIYNILDDKADKTDLSSLETKVNKNQIPRLKIGEDTSKVPNDSYYIETDEVELKKYLSEEKIIFIGDRENVNHEDFENLIDLKGQKMTKKQDDYHVTNLVVNVNDSMVIFKDTYNSLKAQGKDFSNHLIILGIQEEYYYPGILVYFDFIKKITKSRKIIHIFDPILKAKVTQESYDNDVGIMEMVSEPDYLISSVKLLRGGNILRYKDENGVIH